MAEVNIDGNSELPLSVNAVLSNYDLLFEILLRLPALSLVLFKSVSKHWLSLITSPRFVTSRSKIPNIDPPSALLIRRTTAEIEKLVYDFESFDIRIPSKKSSVFTLGSEAPLGRVKILQSCNGLLLCCIDSNKFCVYNPTIKLLKMLPPCPSILVGSMRLAFDPTKSPHYKVIKSAEQNYGNDDDELVFYIQLETYSSEAGRWSVCRDQFSTPSFHSFKEGIYLNGSIHWLNTYHCGSWNCYKLDIMNEHPVLTAIQLPETLDRKSRIRFKLFESRGCLLLLGKDYAHSKQLNIYEMRNGNSEWSVKYIVNLDDIMMPFPNFWMISKCVWCTVLGEREEDSFMIIDLLTKVVQYNLVSKTVRTLCDLKPICFPAMLTNFDGFQFIPSFAGV
ncbi:SGNH hydrolase-type esterase domain-containing protein [Tanacetum coccineum]